MIPFLHLGRLPIPTFGLMVATGLLVAAYILQADFNRRREHLDQYRPGKPKGPEGFLARLVRQSRGDEGFLIIGIAGIAGLIGAKLYHALQDPQTWRTELVSRFGFAWFGGLLGGFFTLLALAHLFRMPVLEFMDACAPAAAVGYAIGRIGCLLSGDGDYGIPTTLPWGMSFPNGTDPSPPHCVERGWPPDCRVHPTPIYEFLIWMLIGWILWRIGKKGLNGEAPGKVFSAYLILTGVARFLMELIRINPRSFFGFFSNAQTASLVSVVLGIILLLRMGRGEPRKA